MNQKERMFRNLPYKAWMDGLPEERLDCQQKLWEYNNLPPQRWEELPALLKNILGGLGEGSGILPPLRCDYGTNIFLGEHVEVNYNLTVLDVGRVTNMPLRDVDKIAKMVPSGPGVTLKKTLEGCIGGALVHLYRLRRRSARYRVRSDFSGAFLGGYRRDRQHLQKTRYTLRCRYLRRLRREQGEAH